MEGLKITHDDFSVLEVKDFLAKRFMKTGARADENKTKRVDKFSHCFNALVEDNKSGKKGIPYRKWSEILENLDEILQSRYKTPSTRQAILSMLRILCVEYAGVSADDWREKYGQKNADLKQEYQHSATAKELKGLSFKEAKAFKSDNPTICLYLRLMCGDMPVLRIGDWINASTIDDGKSNYIDVKKKVMIRRITKNQKGEMIIKLPKIIMDEIKKQKINGYLFGQLNEPQISSTLKKGFPDTNVNSRYFRNLFSTQKILKMKKVEKMRESLEIMDHSKQTWLNVYQKSNMPILKLLNGH
jgi:hypothetical protein